MNEIFYHYTDINGLISILSHEELWLSGIDFMNDNTEGKVVFDRIYNSIDDPSIQRKLGHLFNLCINTNRIFATSFTKNGDQLSQWRGYCPNEGGYSIGFNFDKLEELKIDKPSSENKFRVFKSVQDLLKNGPGQILFDACTYSQEDTFEEQVQVIADFVNEAVKDVSDEHFAAMKKLNYDALSIIGLLNDQEKTNKILDFLFRISKVVALYKDRGFYEENEYRLMYIDKPLPSKPFIRGKNSYPLSFVKAKFDKRAVEEIIIGPTRFEKFARKGLYDLLNSFNLKAQIKCSKIPYTS
jgi:hypothetical protein